MMEWTWGYATFPHVHPQRSCKLVEQHSPAKNGRGMPFPRIPPQFDHCPRWRGSLGIGYRRGVRRNQNDGGYKMVEKVLR